MMIRKIVFLIGFLTIASSSFAQPPVEGRGRVNLSEIGGGRPLYIGTAQKERSPVSADGNFTTLLSGLGPQMLIVFDENNQPWVSIMVFPDDEVYKTAPFPKISNIIVDKRSVAKSIITPTIFHPRQADGAKTAVESLDSFACMPDLLNELGALSDTPMSNLMTQQPVLDAIKSCSKEFHEKMGNPVNEQLLDGLYDAEFLKGLQK